MKLSSESLNYLMTPELETLIKIFNQNGFEIRIAGGAVRDLLRGLKPTDIDLATTATPAEMKKMFTESNTRMINAKGESHGTITARIADKENFEVTTLRIDVATDGRHAEVQFTTDWVLDANRRDLTINSMFLGFDGTVYDYFGGKEDLERNIVKFVGKAEDRIQEDYLRILRYFRFYGRVAVDPNAHLESTLQAIKANAHGLKGISGERLWTELKKILVGNFAPSLIRVMADCGVHQYLGLPKFIDVEEFEKVYSLTEGSDPLPMTHLAALLPMEEQAELILERLKVSNEELSLLRYVLAERSNCLEDAVFHYQGELATVSVFMLPKLRSRVCQLFLYWGRIEDSALLNKWVVPLFPLSGACVIEEGVPRGPHVAHVLEAVRSAWRKSRFTLTKAELKAMVPETYEKLKSNPLPKRPRKASK